MAEGMPIRLQLSTGAEEITRAGAGEMGDGVEEGGEVWVGMGGHC